VLQRQGLLSTTWGLCLKRGARRGGGTCQESRAFPVLAMVEHQNRSTLHETHAEKRKNQVDMGRWWMGFAPEGVNRRPRKVGGLHTRRSRKAEGRHVRPADQTKGSPSWRRETGRKKRRVKKLAKAETARKDTRPYHADTWMG